MIPITLIGPLPPPMGGATRHFLTLHEDLDGSRDFHVSVVNTSRQEGFSKPSRNLAVGLWTIWQIIRQLGSTRILSYHASDRGMFMFGPIVVLLGRLSGKPVILRMFGGSFGDFYERRGRLGKSIIRRFILRADIVLLQTKRLIRQLEPLSTARLEWFSTYIRSAEATADVESPGARERCRRFVFLGHMWKTKGVETMLAVADRLPQDATLDLYGTLDEYTEQELRDRGGERVRYRGFLTHDEVNRRLWDYDCLVLATFHPGEGYPGVIAEAFAHHIPVITTRWLAIPEIVDDSCGLLIEPDNPDQLAAAMNRMHSDSALWSRLRDGARKRADDFNHAVWSGKFERLCRELLDH